MDDLLREFLTETGESLDTVDNQLVRFEQEPNNAKILGNIFRLVHTIKGTCGFIGLPRLEALTHSAETLMGKFRDGQPVTGEAVTLILTTLDRIKDILAGLETAQAEPAGNDDDLIGDLNRMVARVSAPAITQDLHPPEAAIAIEPPAPQPAPLRRVAAEPEIADSDRVANQSIRVNVETLERLMTMVSELVLTRNQLIEINRRVDDSDFKIPLQRLSSVTAELQDSVMKTRMQPIGHAWQKLPRIVRDLAAELGKQIDLELHGAETELDRQVLDLIKDPLTHMVRNSADHGLETPAERIRAGKPEQGTIRLSAYHEGGHIVVCIADNGRGLDTQRIRAKAIASGLATEADIAKMTDAQIHKFIFAPGFSTAAAVTSVSGRGVGMDVVRSNIDRIGGSIDIKSIAGEGASVTVTIPLTLAIISALIVEAAGERFAIPQLAIVELVRANATSVHRVERIKDNLVLRLRERLLPLVHLSALLQLADSDTCDAADGYIVVMQVGRQSFGLVVDGLFHTEEIVVKPMCSKLRHIDRLSGTTILGDGTVIMIVDPNGLARAIGSTTIAHDDLLDAATEAPSGSRDDVTSLLLFRAGTSQPKAIPLALVTRLEDMAIETIETSNGRHVVQYRQQLMPLVLMDGVTLAASGMQAVLVLSDDSRVMGLIVDEIIDIVEERLDIEITSRTDGCLGSAIIKGQATEIIDVAHYLPMAFADWFSRSDMSPMQSAQSLLLVDDSAFFRNMLAPVLKAAGYRVEVATNARDGLTILRSRQDIRAVVTDIDMPEMNGFEFAQSIRADTRLIDLPIIALSALASPAAIERGRQAGFQDYVAKFDRPALIAALKDRTMGHAA